MVAFSSLASLALLGSATALPSLSSRDSYLTKRAGCGEVNIVLTGLPPNHPTVIEQGWDPAMVAAALKSDGEAVIAAGYNYLSVLLGPEVDENATLGAKLEGTYWSVAVTGFGVRGANSSELTHHLESELPISSERRSGANPCSTDTLDLFRRKAPMAVLGFNRSPDTTLEAVKRWAPLDADCTNSPGKSLVSFSSAQR
jgi:hypothetical protein